MKTNIIQQMKGNQWKRGCLSHIKESKVRLLLQGHTLQSSIIMYEFYKYILKKNSNIPCNDLSFIPNKQTVQQWEPLVKQCICSPLEGSITPNHFTAVSTVAFIAHNQRKRAQKGTKEQHYCPPVWRCTYKSACYVTDALSINSSTYGHTYISIYLKSVTVL